MGKVFAASARHAKAREFLELRQGAMTVLQYVAKFTELSRFANDYVATHMVKVRKFEDGLKLSIRGKIVGLLLQDMELGLEVKTLEKLLHVSSPLGTRVSVDLICRDCELEISGILLTMDLRVMDMLEFDVILEMDWLTTNRVVIDCNRRRVTVYTQDDVCVVF